MSAQHGQPPAVTPELRAQADAFLSEPHLHCIGGRWTQGSSSVTLPVENPATEAVISEVVLGTRAEVDAAVAAAREALAGPWGRLKAFQRARMLLDFADQVERNAELLACVETLENGTPFALSLNSTRGLMPELLRYYAGWPTKLTGETVPAAPAGREALDWLVYTEREPIGVVGAITPWNAPLNIILLKLAPALAAGCTVVLKPAELTPLTAELLLRLAQAAGLPDGVLNLVQGRGEEVGAALAEHPGVDKISFTGSTEVGRSIVRAAAGNLKKVTLELGGKSPMVVFPDADLEEAIPTAAMACFFLSGQNCMAGTRLFVHESIHDQFVAGVSGMAQALKVGDGLEPDTVLGPLISAAQRRRVLDYIALGEAEGARRATPPQAFDGPGHFVAPVVFSDCHADMRIVREEIFGPVLTVQRFGSEDVAALAARVNDTIFGLSGSVWSRDLSTALGFARLIDSGQVAVNAHAAVSPETPFGGNRQSGWGREMGRESLDAYLKTKAVSVRL
ncbi:MAG: aldehyde dehydrogenase [Gammaproteobacteria bacterium]|nr:MAG: aldehyde dehydrogenase [Gammaproteobacteria bacterium]